MKQQVCKRPSRPLQRTQRSLFNGIELGSSSARLVPNTRTISAQVHQWVSLEVAAIAASLLGGVL